MQPEIAATAKSAAADRPRHRKLSIFIVVLATVLGFVSVMGVWVKRQALETDTWTETSSELLENEAIREAIADFVVTSLYDNVDVQARVAERLPEQIQGLAGPIAGGLRQLATRATEEALQRPRVQAAWEAANRAAHERLIALLDDEGEFVATTGGVVTLDLTGIVAQIGEQVGIGADLSSKLPPAAGDLEILKSDELEAAQSGVKALRTLGWVLTALTFVLYALAIYLARGRRRETLRMVGFSFAAVGVLILLVRNLAGDAVTSSLTDAAAAEAPVQATWEIATSLLQETAQSLVAYGAVIVLAAWLAGPTAVATSIRAAITPYVRQPRIAYGSLAVVLALLFWWDPVVATSRIAPSILLAGLLAVGVEALRRQVIREFPDRVTTQSAAGAAQAMATRMREAREARVAGGGASAAPAMAASPGEQRIAQLERLASLRDAGVLSDEEMEREKREILSRS